MTASTSTPMIIKTKTMIIITMAMVFIKHEKRLEKFL